MRAGSTLLALALLSGCGLLFQEEPVGPGSRDPAGPESGPREADGAALRDPSDLPSGYGTLRQERISVDLRRGELQMRVTPLSESVTRTAAPDTWERLSALARAHRDLLRERVGTDVDVELFLVAIYSESEPLPFEPGALTLVSRGVRHRPLEIRALTPGWNLQRVGPRETQMAIYAFAGQVDLEGELEVEYQDVRSREWDRVLPEIQAERARVRARAGGDQASIPNFRIFR